MRNFLLRWLINVAGLYVATYLPISGLSYEGDWVKLFGLALIFGLVNAFIRPILSLLTCPLIVLTLGLFYSRDQCCDAVAGFGTRSAGRNQLPGGNRRRGDPGCLVISVVSFVLTMLLRDERENRR